MPTTLEQLQYGFDRDSRRTWRQRATTQGWDNAYAYDSLSQVTGDDRGDLNLAQNTIAGIPANGARWDYDETGNWQGYQTTSNGSATLTQSRTHDKGNRLMEVEGAAAMRTDRAGRVVQAVPGPQQDWSQSWQITWDAWSRITQVSHTEGNEIHRYGYDGITRRITRTNNQTGVTLRSYYNDKWRPVEERKNSETTANVSCLWGARHRDDLVRRDRAVGGTALNETRYILMDYFSPAAITDAAGAVKERYQFSAFGLRTILNPDFTPRTSSECGMEFSFQGQFADLETGWMNYGFRYYLPELGRWCCKDPIGEIGGKNLYVISQNNIVNSVDYLGLAVLPELDMGQPTREQQEIENVENPQPPRPPEPDNYEWVAIRYSCSLWINIIATGTKNCEDHVVGIGYGKTESEACDEAKNHAESSYDKKDSDSDCDKCTLGDETKRDVKEVAWRKVPLGAGQAIV